MKQIAYVKRPFIWSFLVLLFCLTLPVNASEKSLERVKAITGKDEEQPSQNS